MKRIVQTASRYDGTIAALASDASLYQQIKDGRGGFNWQPIEGPPARLVNITARPDGRLVAVAADGTVWEQVADAASAGRYALRWQPVSGLGAAEP